MPVRLACVKHTASVRSEPESNSQVENLIVALNLSRNPKVNKEIAQKSRAIAFIFLSLLLKKAAKRDYSRCKTTDFSKFN